MIGFFPDPYPDELVYSLLARYYIKTGYLGYVCAAEDLFLNKWNLPNIEFLNEYTPQLRQRLENDIGMEHLILNHTMFPVYCRFLPVERRQAAFNALLQFDKNRHNFIPLDQRKKNARHLRFCPVCVKEDQMEFGETYWHRIHQIFGIGICPKHSCRLFNSDIIIQSNATPMLISAEEQYKNNDVEISTDTAEVSLGAYIHGLSKQPLMISQKTTIGEFLRSKLVEKGYSSVRGELCLTPKLFSDMQNYYCDLPENRLTELWKLQKILGNQRATYVEICMVALFLQISPEDLSQMEIPDVSPVKIFDEQVLKLHEQGLKYPEISKRMNASIHIVKAIGEGRYIKYDPTKSRINRGGRRSNNWDAIDRETLPAVQETAVRIWGAGDTRPKRVTPKGVASALGFSVKRFEHMPMCNAEIKKYAETQEQYWAREIIWAAKQIQKTGKQFNLTRFYQLMNINKKQIRRCLPFIDDSIDPTLVKKIKAVFLNDGN